MIYGIYKPTQSRIHMYDSLNVLKVWLFFSQEDNMGFGRPTK